MKPKNKENLFEQLKIDEGVKYHTYLDHLGYHTFGVGHLVVSTDEEFGEFVGTLVSEVRVWEVFHSDLDKMIGECEILFDGYWHCFPGEVQEILVNMMFNMGRTRLSKFKNMIIQLKLHDWAQSAIEGRDSRWHKQVPNRAERLMVRLENYK
jgi:lysozyme